jgi:hypothetical protein
VIEVYAITDHPTPPLPPIALLHAVPAGRLAAVCAAGDDTTALTPDALWRHEDVVEALMADRDLLPVRYGTCLPDDAAVAAAVAQRAPELTAALDRVRGAVELSLRVAAPAGVDGPPEAAAAIHAALAAGARATVRHPPRAAEVLRAAYLVDRDAIERYTALVARLQAEHPDLRLLCTGPWPPYGFTEP